MNANREDRNILALDYGEKVIGMATFHPKNDPFPLTYGKIVVKSENDTMTKIQGIIEREAIDLVVLGLPHYLDGSKGPMTHKVISFGKKLEKRIHPVLIQYQDEAYTTQEAKERMAQSPKYNFQVNMKKIDEVAALILLEEFIVKGRLK